jgi:hypothetical protein
MADPGMADASNAVELEHLHLSARLNLSGFQLLQKEQEEC